MSGVLGALNTPVKPLHYHDIVSVHFNNILLHRDLWQIKHGLRYVHLYIYISMWMGVDLTSSMRQERFKFQILLNYAINSRKCRFRRLVVALKPVEMNWFPVTYILTNLITNSIHAWLINDYRLAGIIKHVIHTPVIHV